MSADAIFNQLEPKRWQAESQPNICLYGLIMDKMKKPRADVV